MVFDQSSRFVFRLSPDFTELIGADLLADTGDGKGRNCPLNLVIRTDFRGAVLIMI